MASANDKIREVLGRYDVPYEGNVWAVQGTPVIKHMALELVAARAEIEFDKPTILRAERDEAVILVAGHICAINSGSKTMHAWSIGEALVNINYKVSGKQAAYVYAMAEKRAKDRVILKLVGLHGQAYSEDEADDFKQRNGQAPAERRQQFTPMTVEHMLHEISECQDAQDLSDLKSLEPFRSGYRAADELSRKRIEQALAKAAEEAAA